MLGERSMPSSNFLHIAGWNVDVMSGAHVAISDFEAEVLILWSNKREGTLFLMTSTDRMDSQLEGGYFI